MNLPFLGEICSVGAALLWAAAVVLFRKSGERVAPFDLNLFKTVISLALFLPTIPLMGESLVPDNPLDDWLWLLAAGLVGVSLADTLFFIALDRLGAGLTAVVDCLYSPSVILFSFLFLGERIGLFGYLGAGCVISAILVGAAGGALPGTSRRDLVLGIVTGVLSMICMALAVVMTKEVLDRSPVLWTSTVRLLGGAAGLLLLALIVPRWRGSFGVFRPRRVWRVMLPGSVLGNYVAMIVWIAGVKYTLASTAAILNQLSTIFIFLLAAVFLAERISLRRGIAVTLAVAGAVLVAAQDMLRQWLQEML